MSNINLHPFPNKYHLLWNDARLYFLENKKRPHPYKGRGLRVATLFNNLSYKDTLNLNCTSLK
ncbi:hypothetical protein C7Q39_00220 [Staphylococcus aureus]|nr:hypothetical protein C7Q39_00220 [Staphylococcus aureus]